MELYPYQKRAVDHVLKNKRCALWMEMGLGKSAVTLTALKDLPKPAIVLAPKRVVDHVWEDEASKWYPEAKVVSVVGTPSARTAKLRTPADIFVINYELLSWLLENGEWRWPTVVLDEATRVKNQSSKLFKGLRKVAGSWQHCIQLTGSPAPNGLIDLWGQMYLLDRGARLGKTVTAFRNRWFRPDYMGWSFDPLPHAQEEIEFLCADLCISMSAEDYLDLPDMMITDIQVDLPKDARRQYDKLKDDLVAVVDNELITAMSAATLIGKLLQLTSGAVYDESGKVLSSHSTKVDAVEEIVSTLSGENVVVVYQFKHELEALRERFPQGVEVRDNKNTVKDWNNGKIPMLFIHPASAGLGLNLQHGGRHMIWTTPTWNLEHYQQTNARLHRRGQTKPVMIYRVVCNDSADQRVIGAIGSKDAVQTALLDALK